MCELGAGQLNCKNATVELSNDGQTLSRLAGLYAKQPTHDVVDTLAVSGCTPLSSFPFGPGNRSPTMATNVVIVVVVVVVGVLLVIRFSIPQGLVVSQPMVMKLFTRINENILHQAIMADF